MKNGFTLVFISILTIIVVGCSKSMDNINSSEMVETELTYETTTQERHSIIHEETATSDSGEDKPIEETEDPIRDLFLLMSPELTFEEVKQYCNSHSLKTEFLGNDSYNILAESEFYNRYPLAESDVIFVKSSPSGKITIFNYKHKPSGIIAWWVSLENDPVYEMTEDEYCGYYMANPSAFEKGLIGEIGETNIQAMESAQAIIDEMDNYRYSNDGEPINPIEKIFLGITSDTSRTEVESMIEENGMANCGYADTQHVLDSVLIRPFDSIRLNYYIYADCFQVTVYFDGKDSDSKVSQVIYQNPYQMSRFGLIGYFCNDERLPEFDGTSSSEGYGYYVRNPEAMMEIVKADGTKKEEHLVLCSDAEELLKYIKTYEDK